MSDHSQYGPNLYGQYSVTLSVLLQVLHIPEFLALLWGYLYRSERNIYDQRCQHCPTYCCSIIPIVFILLSYFLVGFFVGVFQLPLTYCKTDAPLWWLPLFRGLLTMVVHIFTFLARAFMAWQCIRGLGVFWEATINIRNACINTIGRLCDTQRAYCEIQSCRQSWTDLWNFHIMVLHHVDSVHNRNHY